jgi:hypothetical protein
MGKCYNFVFDSNFNTGGATTSRRTYATNWLGVLPENKSFKVSFSFMSETDASSATAIGFTHVPILRCNLGQSNTFANLASNATSFATTNTLGFLKFQLLPSGNVAGTADRCYLVADNTTNAPIYIKQRPSNSSLEVEIHNGLTNTNFTNIPDYVLTLHFEEEDY